MEVNRRGAGADPPLPITRRAEVVVTRALRSLGPGGPGPGLVADSESVFETEGLVSTLSFAGDRLVSAALFHESVDSMAVLSALPMAPQSPGSGRSLSARGRSSFLEMRR